MKKIIILLLLLITACGKTNQNEKNKKIEPSINVKVAEATTGEIYETFDFSGDIHAQKEVKIFARVSGKLSRKIKTEGESVKENEPIAYINRDEIAMNFEDAEVRSTINGILCQYFVGIGESVFPAQTPIALVADITTLTIEVYATEKELTKINKGQIAKVRVDTFPNKIFKGTITEIEPVINPVTRKSKIKIELKNETRILKPGMFATVEIITNVYRNIVIPKSSVLKKLDEEVVFIVDEENRAKMVPVVTEISDNEKIIIKHGLKKGQKVIYWGNFGLIEGTKLEITQ